MTGEGAVGGAHGQPGRGVDHDRLDDRPDGGGVVVGIGADRHHHAHHGDEDEVAAVPPTGDESGQEGQDRNAEAPQDEGDALRVVDRRLGPRAHPVGPVEVPVPEAPEDLRGQRGGAGGRHGLGVFEDVDPVGGLDLQADGPPQRGQGGQAGHLPGHPPGPAPGGLPRDEHGIGQPQGRRDPHVEDGTGVDPADQGHHQREQGREAPTPLAQGQDDEGQHPGQPGPGHEDDGDASRVLQHVRREHVRQGGHVPARPGQPEHPAEVERPGPGHEEQATHPEPLSHPQGHVQLGHHPVEGPHRQQVADVLVGHGAEAHAGVPHGDGLADVPPGIEVEVRLGVVGHGPGLGGQHGDEGDDGQEQVVHGRPHRPGGAQAGVEGPLRAGCPVRGPGGREFCHRHEWSVV